MLEVKKFLFLSSSSSSFIYIYIYILLFRGADDYPSTMLRDLLVVYNVG